jgi:hypothetical protein
MGDRLQGQQLASKAEVAEAAQHQLGLRVPKGEPADAGSRLQTSEFPRPELNMDRQRHPDMSIADRRIEQLVDRSLPFQLAGLVAVHESTICASS